MIRRHIREPLTLSSRGSRDNNDRGHDEQCSRYDNLLAHPAIPRRAFRTAGRLASGARRGSVGATRSVSQVPAHRRSQPLAGKGAGRRFVLAARREWRPSASDPLRRGSETPGAVGECPQQRLRHRRRPSRRRRRQPVHPRAAEPRTAPGDLNRSVTSSRTGPPRSPADAGREGHQRHRRGHKQRRQERIARLHCAV